MGNLILSALPIVLAVLAVLLAAIGDLRSGRVPKWLTYGTLACGLGFGLAAGGWHGGVRAFLAATIAFAPPFLMRLVSPGAIGGGDVKLLAGLGALLYRRDRHEQLTVGLEIFLLATVIGSVFALFILARKGILFSSFVRIFRSVSGKVVPGVAEAAPAPSPKMRFAPMIALATLAVVTRTAEKAYEVIL